VSVHDLTPQPVAAYRDLRPELGDLTTPTGVIVQQRWERAEISRRKLIRRLQKDRDRVLMLEELGRKKGKGGGLGEVRGPKASAEEVLMARERKYLEKVQKKTEKELKQLLVFEMKRSATHHQQQAREAKQVENDEKRREEKEAARRENAERRFQKSEAMKAAKEKEDEALRRTTLRQFEENARLQQIMEEQRQEERCLATKKAQDRAELAAEKKRMTAAIFKKQQADIIAKDALNQERDIVRRHKVEENDEARRVMYRARRGKAELRIEEAKKIAEDIVVKKRTTYEEKEFEAKQRREVRNREKEEAMYHKKIALEEEMAKRKYQKFLVDQKAEDHMAEIVRKEAIINKRLQARGLLGAPMDRMRKEDEEEKRAILASLESTKEIEAKKIRRVLREETIEINMQRRAKAEEYKKEKIMTKMDEDKKKLVKVQKERAELNAKREMAANEALKNRHQVAEMTKKVLGNPKTADMLKEGGDLDDVTAMVSEMLGFEVAPKEKKVIKATKITKKKVEEEKRGEYGGDMGSTIQEDEVFVDEQVDLGFGSSVGGGSNEYGGESSMKWEYRAPVDPYAEVENIRRRQNTELLQILKEEQASEEERERRIKDMVDGGVDTSEMGQVKERFSRERNEASNRMVRYARIHEEVLAAALRTAKEQSEAIEVEAQQHQHQQQQFGGQ